MATLKLNSKSPTIRRILKEAVELSSSPSPDYTAAPLESDLFEWHFTFRGPPNSAYGDGIYHGRIVLPPTYPLRPPSFRFSTPSGRFEVNREICLSISGHHEETWQPAWGVRTALVALRSFMESDPRGQLGGLEATDAIRRRHAQASQSYQCPTCAKTNAEIIKECEESTKAGEASKEVEVPSELKMGWKDEMGKPADSGTGLASAEDQMPGEESAALAEGFVSTLTSPETNQSASLQATSSTVPDAGSSRAQGPCETPQQTHSAPPPVAEDTPPAQLQIAAEDGVPVWVDRAIVIVVVILVAMVLKALLDD